MYLTNNCTDCSCYLTSHTSSVLFSVISQKYAPPPPILHITLSPKRGGCLYLNIWLVSTIRPHNHVDEAKSRDVLPVAIQRNSISIGMYHENFQVCWLPTEEWQRDKVHCQWWQEMEENWMVQTCVYVFRGIT